MSTDPSQQSGISKAWDNKELSEMRADDVALWRTYGASALALVGAPEDIAEGIMAFKEAGVSHFILSGWPKWDAMLDFGKEVLPRVRQHEQKSLLQHHTA